MEVSASAISAWPQTMPPCRHKRSEKAMRRIAPGCQSSAAPDGGAHSIRSTDRPRSCTHGANTSPRTRLASSILNCSVGCSCCMNAGSSPGCGSAFLNAFCGNGHSQRGLKMPDLKSYEEGGREYRGDVQ